MTVSPELYKWEDVSESFCLIRIAQITGRKLLVLVDKSSTPEEVNYIKRYLGLFHGLDVSYGLVMYNHMRRIAFVDNESEIKKRIEACKPIIIAWHSRSRIVIDQDKDAFFDAFHVSHLTLPNYRHRCEEIFLEYYGKENEVAEIAACLYDDESRDVLKEILRASFENDIYRLPEGSSATKYFDCYRHLEDEVWINCGACRGDTIMNFLAQGYSFKRIFAVEGDKTYFNDLQTNLQMLPAETGKRIRFLDFYLNINTDSEKIDKIFQYQAISLVNMDIEGFEIDALKALEQIIIKNRPVLAVAAYHNATDLKEIPAFVSSRMPGYNFFLRKYCGAEPNAFNEYIYYCVPAERMGQ